MNTPSPTCVALTVAQRQLACWMDESLGRIETHPFLRNLRAGTLGMTAIRRWIFCAGRESRAFPDLLQGMLGWTNDPTLTRVLKANLDDELGNGNRDNAHFQHYLHLLTELEISRDRFDRYLEGPGITAALLAARHIAACRSDGLALGYMAINEGMTPAIYSAVERGLCHEGVAPASDFFRLHVSVDEHHVAMLLSACDAAFEHDAQIIRDGVLLGERCMAVLLDEANGVFGDSP